MKFTEYEPETEHEKKFMQSAKHYRDEAQYYRDTLDTGVLLLCKAVDVDPERYDTDQADGECYLDCFKEMAALLKNAGIYYCNDDWEFKQKLEEQ